jgi:hypothetical protein
MPGAAPVTVAVLPEMSVIAGPFRLGSWKGSADRGATGYSSPLCCNLPLSGEESTIGVIDMAYDIPPPKQLPEPGYYYHFKHDPQGPVNNYAYYIYGVGHHTEDDCRSEDAFMQVYRPLYEEAYAYRNGGLFDLRPLHMFYDPAEWKGRKVPRFAKIVVPDVIAQLEAIRARMYPNP